MALLEVRAPMHKNRTTTMGRVKGFYQTGQFFSYINISSKNYTDSWGYKTLEHFPILGPHGTWLEYDYDTIKAGPWNPASTGQQFGPTWTTHWFHVTFDNPPANWDGKEVHLRVHTGNETMLYDADFNILQGMSSGFREEYIIAKPWDSANPKPLEFYIEMACGGLFGAGAGDLIAPPNDNQFRTLDRIDLAVFDRGNWELTVDFDQINGIAEVLGDSHIGYQAMFVTNEMVNQLRIGNRDKAKEIAAAFFQQGPGEKSHTLYAMGHCHIDCAWLWPYDETIRKCARSFSAQLGLMDEYPDLYKFVCSSAQQFAWVQEHYPGLYDKIKAQVAAGNFMPVGGCWVEMDGNMPNGEAFLRQFYYGQHYFMKEFGIQCREFWLPDTFGYSAQIPQMCKHVGIDRFLTQKMSWSAVNKFPNHNFWWEGIDGTAVLTHFPPGDGYGMNGSANEFLRSQNNSLDKGRANCGVFLYGYGDGGGGPTRQIIERIKRMTNVDGMPRVKFSDSNEFFTELEKESSKFYRWVGELYLELHNGTYTSQARIKWYNRKCEFLFREVEFLMAMAYSTGKVLDAQVNIDMLTMDSCWKDFLLNQFHDVLPGSCIEWAAKDAWAIYEKLMAELFRLRKEYNGLLLGEGNTKKAVFNSLPWGNRMVVFVKPDEGEAPSGPNVQAVTLDSMPFENAGEGRFRVPNTFSAALVDIQASGFSEFVPLAPTVPVTYANGTWSNGMISLNVDQTGTLPVESLIFDGNKDAFNDYLQLGVSPGMFYIYDDIPNYWDAWDVMDFHLETRRLPNFTNIQVENFAENGPLVGGYKFSANFGNGSSVTRYTIMRAESPMIEYYTIVDWHEDHKLLKVEFPIDVLSRDATFEIQFGHAKRPTHINTSWEMAKYEVCGHKWVDISQNDKGVTIINDSKYGFHVRDNHVQMSLLKSPKNPDKNCDMHKHYIYYAVLPHTGTFQGDKVIQRAYELNTLGSNNVPLIASGDTIPANFVVSSNPAVFIEAVKVSKVTSATVNTLCLRLYEGYGGVATTEISLNGITINEVTRSNGLEEGGGQVVPSAGNKFTLDFKPFQIQTFLVTF